jgi:hypothetical protein
VVSRTDSSCALFLCSGDPDTPDHALNLPVFANNVSASFPDSASYRLASAGAVSSAPHMPRCFSTYAFGTEHPAHVLPAFFVHPGVLFPVFRPLAPANLAGITTKSILAHRVVCLVWLCSDACGHRLSHCHLKDFFSMSHTPKEMLCRYIFIHPVEDAKT